MISYDVYGHSMFEVKHEPMKVELQIFATKNVALVEFEKHFFAGIEPFYLKNYEKWLGQILKWYQDTGMQPFQAIKVSGTFSCVYCRQ